MGITSTLSKVAKGFLSAASLGGGGTTVTCMEGFMAVPGSAGQQAGITDQPANPGVGGGQT